MLEQINNLIMMDLCQKHILKVCREEQGFLQQIYKSEITYTSKLKFFTLFY